MGEAAMAAHGERYRQAAWAYVVYGVVYWLGGLALAQSGLGPRGMERGGAAWFVVGALFVVVFPWILMAERGWFTRWILSRRDFARILTLLVVDPRGRGGADRPDAPRRDHRRPRPRRAGPGRRLGLLPPHHRHGGAARAGGVEPPAVSASSPPAEPGGGEVRWTPEAEARVARAPMFLRGMVRRLAEKRARAEGVRVITPELMTRYKSEMMGLAESGAYKVPQAGRRRGPRRRWRSSMRSRRSCGP